MPSYAGFIIILSPYFQWRNRQLNSATKQFSDLSPLLRELLNLSCTFVNCQDTHRNL
jgi:hypothetical protein